MGTESPHGDLVLSPKRKVRKTLKETLLQKLRRKMGIGQEDNQEQLDEEPGPSSTPYMKNNKVACRKTRKVELGWIHDGKQL